MRKVLFLFWWIYSRPTIRSTLTNSNLFTNIINITLMDTLFKNTRHPSLVLLFHVHNLIVLNPGIDNFSVDSFTLTLVPFYTYNSKLYMVSLTQYYNYGKNQSPSLGNLVETTSPFYVYVFPR